MGMILFTAWDKGLNMDDVVNAGLVVSEADTGDDLSFDPFINLDVAIHAAISLKMLTNDHYELPDPNDRREK